MRTQLRPRRIKSFPLLLAAILALFLMLTAQWARADFLANEFPPLDEQISRTSGTCHDLLSCQALGLEIRVIYDGTNSGSEASPEFERLHRIARNQANFWGDSILEGDFAVENSVSMDRVEGIYRDGSLIAYRITYSARAWRLHHDGTRGLEGRIIEASFVSKALRSWFRDADQMAAFH